MGFKLEGFFCLVGWFLEKILTQDFFNLEFFYMQATFCSLKDGSFVLRTLKILTSGAGTQRTLSITVVFWYLFPPSLHVPPTSKQKKIFRNHRKYIHKPRLPQLYIPFSPLSHQLNSNKKFHFLIITEIPFVTITETKPSTDAVWNRSVYVWRKRLKL